MQDFKFRSPNSHLYKAKHQRFLNYPFWIFLRTMFADIFLSYKIDMSSVDSVIRLRAFCVSNVARQVEYIHTVET